MENIHKDKSDIYQGFTALGLYNLSASRNVLAAGQAVIVCGSDVRPDRHISKGQLSKTRKGRKQKPKS